MPTYEYLCQSCGEAWEERHAPSLRLTEASCPECGQQPAKTEFSLNGNFHISMAESPKTGASFREISPTDDQGKPIWTVKEAVHAGFSGYVSGEAERIEAARVEQDKADVDRMIKESAKDAWNDRKVVIRD